MGDNGIDEDVAAFIRRHISTVEHLEVLLLLLRDPRRTWTAEAVAHELRTSRMSADNCLRHLRDHRLAAPEGQAYRFASSPDLEVAARRAEAVYHERRVSMITLIFSNPHDPVRAFADAFKLRK